MTKEWEETKKELLEHRRENFVVEITTKDDIPGNNLMLSFPEENEIVLHAAPNGRDFQSISLLSEEVDKVIKALIPHTSLDCLQDIYNYVLGLQE